MKAAKKAQRKPRRKAAAPAPAVPAVPTAGTVLVLRTCLADMRSLYTSSGFVWPESGPVECPDWKPMQVCGNGLHGALWGEGDGGLFCWNPDAKWLVVEVAEKDVIDLGGKVKFPRGVVVYCGDAFTATKYIADRASGRVIIGGTAKAGDGGTAQAGDGGTAQAGDRGTAKAGDGGTAQAGDGGEIQIRWYDGPAGRYRTAIAYVGEDGVTAGVAYVVREGKVVKKDVTP